MRLKDLWILILVLLNSCSVPKNLISDNLESQFERIDENSGIYYLKLEVTNEMYNEFLSEIKNSDIELYERYKIDSTKWLKEGLGEYNDPLMRSYSSHEYMKDFPVVNITYEGARSYCEWLTKKIQKDNRQIIFRLPTREEFMKLAETVNIEFGSDSPETYESYNFNLRFEGDFATDGSVYPTISYATKNKMEAEGEQYIQNNLGFYHVIGNVEELLENGQSIGGSWYSYPSESLQVNNHKLPDPRVGFRIIMEKK